MNLLAIETSTDACSVALGIGDEVLVDHRVEPRRHAQLLLPMIDAMLAESGLARRALDGIAFGQGPGSFTGVRVAASVTQGIALGLDIGVVGVSSLATVAEGCRRAFGDTRVGVALDARLDEIYWGAFTTADGVGLAGDVMDARVTERVCAPERATFADPDAVAADGSSDESGNDTRAWTLAGAGAERYAAELRQALGLPTSVLVREARLPEARDTLALARVAIARGGLGGAETAVPVYLRERVARTEEERGIRR